MCPLPISDAEILQEAQRAELERVHVALPGFVTAYDPATQTADVQPALKRPLLDELGAVAQYEELPVVPSVPVCFPRGGGFHVSFPLNVGDSVLLVMSECAIGEWQETGDVSEPADVRRHGLSGAFAIPGGYPLPKTIADASAAASALVVGRDGHDEQIRIPAGGGEVRIGASASDHAALASKIDAFIAVFQAWTPTGTVGDAAALRTALNAVIGTAGGPAYSTAATLTKVQ